MDLSDADLQALLSSLDEEQFSDLVDGLPPGMIEALLGSPLTGDAALTRAHSPAALARMLDERYVDRPHLDYLSDRIAAAVRDVEAGKNRMLVISTPPRVGKSTLLSLHTPTWVLQRHPDWDTVLVSHEGSLATSWGRQIRRAVEDHPDLGIDLARDYGAASEWETAEGGHVLARGIRGSLTGRGARVLIIDDPVKDFVEAHSEAYRQAAWEWWLSVAQTRLEPPYLVLVVMTRWHEDDFAGRLLSDLHEGDPSDWEVISLPAIAEENDVLGREPGEPLLSPLVQETPEEAVTRWETTRRSVGTYMFSAMYQQHPSAAKGSIFNTDWWRYWTLDPAKASRTPSGEIDPNGKVVLLTEDDLAAMRWIDSWDCAFKGEATSDYVVGQRWALSSSRKYLIDQSRERRDFTDTLREIRRWSGKDKDNNPHPNPPPYTPLVRERLIEDKANGTAIITTIKEHVSGVVPVSPKDSKEARARAVSPDVEAGDVFLPLPSDPGKAWVTDLTLELTQFPTGAHDDQVDALTQVLLRERKPLGGSIVVPGRTTRGSLSRGSIGQVALRQRGRSIR